MVLNPALYDALQTYLGEVRVTDENQNLSWSWDRTQNPPKPRIDSAGEQYYVCCPVCGDTRHRLAVGHRFLTVLDKIHSRQQMTHNFRCYNEDCDIRQHASFGLIKQYVERNKGLIGLAVARQRVAGQGIGGAPVQAQEHRLPVGFTPLNELPPDHPACVFVRNKYGFDPGYIGRSYGVGYTGVQDPQYPTSYNRVVFPIWFEGKLVSWQGRSLDADHPRRWVFPPGFKKVLFNWDSLPRGRGDVIVISEGIPSAIASGPTATAIFGKEISNYLCQLIVQNFRTAVIATDPETMVPDPNTRRKLRGGYDPNDEGKVFAKELKDKLDNMGLKIPAMLMPYPDEVMDIARRAAQERRAVQDGSIPKPEQWMKVPDPADLGIAAMQRIHKTLPRTHWSQFQC